MRCGTTCCPWPRVVTPNIPEAEVLTGLTIATLDDAIRAAHAIRALGARAVIVKGGHLDRPDIIDVLVDGDAVVQLVTPRLRHEPRPLQSHDKTRIFLKYKYPCPYSKISIQGYKLKGTMSRETIILCCMARK